MNQYSLMSKYYDRIYGFKDYSAEIYALLEIINTHLKYNLKTLLDVAYGTGKHLEILKMSFKCEGLDISSELLDIAIERNPDIILHLSDMIDFHINHKFDIITCFFGSIGHVKKRENLFRTIRNMKKHLNHGGLLVIEPWPIRQNSFRPEEQVY